MTMDSQPIVIYTTRYCPFCTRARQLFSCKGGDYKEIAVDFDVEKRLEMVEKSGRRTVPQIWIGDEHVGGCDELLSLERSGRLDTLVMGVRNE